MDTEQTLITEGSKACTAVPFKTQHPCEKTATLPQKSPNFCPFHFAQCQRLYIAYKRRHQRYEELWLPQNRPPCFPEDGYETNDWSDFTNLDDLVGIRNYLGELYCLLDRCIFGRQVHHDHFYKDTSDYGHEAFLVGLKEHRTVIGKALSRLEIRALELRHQKESWYQWTKTLQEQEDQRRQARKERIDKERRLAAKHRDAVEQMKAKEKAKNAEIEEQWSVWDPVEDLIMEQRDGYVALIRIMLQREPDPLSQPTQGIERAAELGRTEEGKLAKVQKSVDACLDKESAIARKHGELEFGKFESTRFGIVRMSGCLEDGPTSWMPHEEDGKLSQIYKDLNDLFFRDRGGFSYSPEDSSKSLFKMKADFAAVQEHIFLRLVAKSPTLLSAATNKSSIEELLEDVGNVKNLDLRDLALRLADPDLMAVRNACADYSSVSAHENFQDGSSLAGDANGARQAKVKLCGKWIYEQSLTTELSRLGWFHLVLTTGLPLRRAYELCTSWHELRKLDFLVLQNYFAGVPNKTWSVRQESLGAQNLRRLGCLPLWPHAFNNFHARNVQKWPGADYRNILHAIMGRDDKATRRFIYMLRSFPASCYVWVRDAQTGKVIYSSTADDDTCTDAKWLIRRNPPGCRNSKLPRRRSCDEVTMDNSFIVQLKKDRDWVPNKLLKDYVELIIWDRNTAIERKFDHFLFSLVVLLNKANRFHDPLIVYEQDLEEHRRCIEEEEILIDPLAKEKLDKIDGLRQAISTHRQEAGPWANSERSFYTETDNIIDHQFHPFDDDPIWGDTESFQITIDKETMHRAQTRLGPNAGMFDLMEYFHNQKSASHIIPESPTPPKERLNKHQKFWKTIEQQHQYLLAWAESVGRFQVPRFSPANGLIMNRNMVRNAYSREALVRVMASLEDDILEQDGSGLKLLEISSLRDNHNRAKTYPDRRKTIPSADIYDQWDAFLANNDLDGTGTSGTEKNGTEKNGPPEDWVRETLSTVLRLWKDGVISPTDIRHPSFAPFAAPDKASYAGLRTYFDYRLLKLSGALYIPPETIPEDRLYLKHELFSFMDSLSDTARFSLLKLKSGEFHYPMPLLPQNETRDRLIFVDIQGRRWRWNFYPKDLPGAERTMHSTLSAAISIIGKDKRKLNDWTRVRVETVLVAGRTAAECIKNTADVAARMEYLGDTSGCKADWARSFVCVEHGMLMELDNRWWYD